MDESPLTDDAAAARAPAAGTIGAPSDRVRVRRHADRADYDRDAVRAVLDEGLVAHVGITTPDGPVVIPMAYGHDGVTLYLHGAAANALLGGAADAEVCVTVTLLDGLVFARSAYHNSMLYRSVVVRGRGRTVTDAAERERALQLVSDHIVQTWSTQRPVSASEIRRTSVLAVDLTEASLKVRGGGPSDEPDDLDGPYWAGVVPLSLTAETPVSAGDLPADVEAPPHIVDRFGPPG